MPRVLSMKLFVNFYFQNKIKDSEIVNSYSKKVCEHFNVVMDTINREIPFIVDITILF